MTTQTIEVDVPNGYEISKIDYFSDSQYIKVRLKEKIQLRRIVLEQLRCDYKVMPGEFYGDEIAGFCRNNHDDVEMTLHLPKTIWREVKETDIPLTNDEPKLSLSVGECRDLIICEAKVWNKLDKFIKDK